MDPRHAGGTGLKAMRVELETFVDAAGQAPAETPPLGEEARLAAFEQGYSAGWDDALAAQEAETARLREELGRAIADLGFGYREAHRHVLMALRPLLVDMVGKVLPAIARATLSEIVLELVMPAAEAAAGRPVEIRAHPDAVALIEPAVAAQSVLPAVIRPDPALTPGQVLIRGTDGEQKVDLDGVIAAIGRAVATFFEAAAEPERRQGAA
ncbi:MAG: flagellar biosynthesis protein [Rhodobacteraceae bacterium]|nr:flagellar biosynthesis protein [Paracoccaceae bacterium]